MSETPEVFISYASRNVEPVVRIVSELEAAGVRVWRDQHEILGGGNYGSEIVSGIKQSKVLILMCTEAALRSKNVKQEIQLAWHYDVPYLPLQLEPIGYPEQVQYWLEGWQWVEVLDHPDQRWLPAVLKALARAGVATSASALDNAQEPTRALIRPAEGLAGLRGLARFTDQLWPVRATAEHSGARAVLRDLGAPQEDVLHRYPLGSRLRLALESDREGHLLLLDEGTSGKIYCLCPSHFAPQTRIDRGRTYLPQPQARHDAFEVSGQPGREHLVALISEEPLGLDWMPADPRLPARELCATDVAALLARLRELPADRWVALSTYFEVAPA